MASSGSFSGTFTGTWSTTQIIVTSGTGTVAQLYADIGDAEPFSSPSANIYQVNGNRELELRTGVDFDIEDDTLQWALTAAKYPILDVQSGATIRGSAGGSIIGDINDTQYSYIYLSGNAYFQGENGNNFTITQYRSLYIYQNGNTTDFDYVTLSNSTYTYGYYIYISGNYAYNPEGATTSFVNVTITSNDNSGYYIFFDAGADATSIEFDTLTMSNGLYGIQSYGGTYKIKNSTVRETYYYSAPQYTSGSKVMSGNYATSKTKRFSTGSQPFVIYENCTFGENYDSSSTEWCFYAVDNGSTVLFVNCTFEGASAGDPASYGVSARYGGIAIYYGTTTFTNVTTSRYWSADGTHLHARRLTLTVTDGSDPIADATVVVRQKEGNEYWTFKTDSNGQIKTIYGDDPIFIEKEETSTGSYDQWSDGNSNQIHIIEVVKTGYNADTREVAFTEDKNITIALNATSSNPAATKIYDSTFYDSTIY